MVYHLLSFYGQNINKVQIELKQWLYKNGDQCMYNTGGWIKCLNTLSTQQGKVGQTNGGVYTSDCTGSKTDAKFNADSITMAGSLYSAQVKHPSTSHKYGRGGGTVETSICTVKQLTKNIQVYSKAHIIGGDSHTGRTFRVGSANSASTSLTTATILNSAYGPSTPIASESGYPYIVIGGRISYATYEGWGDPGMLNEKYNLSITGIYLE